MRKYSFYHNETPRRHILLLWIRNPSQIVLNCTNISKYATYCIQKYSCKNYVPTNSDVNSISLITNPIYLIYLYIFLNFYSGIIKKNILKKSKTLKFLTPINPSLSFSVFYIISKILVNIFQCTTILFNKFWWLIPCELVEKK